jgi:photosystem II stability/assembly factor-like uncharacterized protein
MKIILKYCGLAALLAGAAFCLPNCDDDNGTGPKPYDGPWKIVPCPEGPSYLKSVFFLNPDLGYAVGCRHILKYNGANWEIDYVYPKDPEKYSVGFHGVWFNGRNDGWVVGSWYDIENKIQKGLILHYDGSTWKEVDHNTPSVWFEDVFFLDKNRGWVAGYGIAQWDGNEWTYETDIAFITDMFFNSPTDGWAVSKYSERIYHYDGTTWKKAHEDSWGVELSSVFFVTPDHGWAGANRGVKSGAQSPLLEYKDGKWSYFQLEIRRSGINAIHFSSPNCGWAAEQYTYYHDGNKWKYVKDPVTNFITDVFTLSEDDAWAVGEGRTILHYQP